MFQKFKWLALMSVLLLTGLAGCSSPTVTPESQAQAKARVNRVWPNPPQQARIRYLKSVSKPSEWGIERSFFRRLADSLTGGAEPAFARPSAVVEANGVLYVADPGAQALWLLDKPNSSFLRLTQLAGEGLISPVALALRDDGAVFVADTGLKKIFLVDLRGRVVRVFASQGLERPAGLAWHEPSHRLYVLDSLRNRITVFDGNGALIRHIGDSGGGALDGQFNRPTHITLDADGTLLVNDALNFRLQWLDRDGKFIHKFGKSGNGTGDFAASKGVAADAQGHYYVADTLFDAVQIFDRQGQLLLTFGERGTGPGQLSMPRGVFVSSQDHVYVADAYNGRIQIFSGAIATGKED